MWPGYFALSGASHRRRPRRSTVIQPFLPRLDAQRLRYWGRVVGFGSPDPTHSTGHAYPQPAVFGGISRPWHRTFQSPCSAISRRDIIGVFRDSNASSDPVSLVGLVTHSENRRCFRGAVQFSQSTSSLWT